MDLWSLTQDRINLDAEELAKAIEVQVQQGDSDYRTRLLVRDATDALRGFWGRDRFQAWVDRAADRNKILTIAEAEFPEVGFPSLEKRIEVSTRPETIRQYLRELGSRLTVPVSVVVGGSSSLILAGVVARRTEVVELVDEVPPPLKALHSELTNLKGRYGLVLGPFRPHCLPTGWEDRLVSQESFRRFEVSCVAPLDVAVGKLMSRRDKDLDDLRMLKRHFDRDDLEGRLQECRSHLADPELRAAVQHNWYVLFGEEWELPEGSKEKHFGDADTPTRLVVSDEDFDRIVEMIQCPPPPTTALIRLMNEPARSDR